MSPTTENNNTVRTSAMEGVRSPAMAAAPDCRFNRRRAPALQATTEESPVSSASSSPTASLTITGSPATGIASPLSQHIAASTVSVPANAPDSMDTEELPAGCVMGVVVPMGRPVSQFSIDSGALDLALMRSIQGDNYRFLRHMIILGWSPVNPRACNFSITTKLARSSQSEVLNIREASPLHYAICCGSLLAASALLIAFPELAALKCKVKATNGNVCREGEFTALDLARYFVSLYVHGNAEKLTAYQQAHQVLLMLHASPSTFPFISHATPQARLVAAGKEPQAVAASLFR
eukprot:CAMPEP_0177716672 /NCGR_PEP_ID=MMETSP0484_2-20121128/14629_1 /TAXON_ID=354590 /ORGANISM="Rhodomonas lens, Strain RHODO" /LENGTH=292 /DNA_ID=CAMNT_0019228707 /DNA_START=13 /DNA_END=888 /DNA_ORIENTATION=-